MRTHSLLWWTFNRLLLVVLLTTLLVIIYLNSVMREVARNHHADMLAMQVTAAQNVLLQHLASDETTPHDLNGLCQEIARTSGTRVSLIDNRGDVLGDSHLGPHSSASSLQLPDVAEAQKHGKGFSQETSGGNGRHVQHQAIALVLPNGDVYILRLSSEVIYSGLSLQIILTKAILPSLLLLAMLYVAARVISRRVRQQAEELGERMVLFSDEEVAVRCYQPDANELAPIANSFNQMANRLEWQIRDLQLEKRQWLALFTGMREGLIAVDSEFNMITINQAARMLLGLSDEDALEGRPLFIAIRNANLNHFIHEVFRSKSGHLEKELEIRSANNEVMTYRLSGVCFEYESGADPGAIVVMHDITAVKRLEEMRKDFVANVSHELKTPITSMKGFLETLQTCIEDGDITPAKRFLGIIGEQTDRLNAIIDDLLTLSRLEQASHWVARDFEWKDLRDAVNSSIRTCSAKIKARKITLLTELPGQKVYGNHRLLEQAITNLIDNAVKYSPENSRVQVAIANQETSVEVRVRDHGPGIPEDHLDRVFERFHRVDKSRDRQTGGTGLGLSIVKHIARVHGGSVHVHSKEGEGALFILHLPKRSSMHVPGSNT